MPYGTLVAMDEIVMEVVSLGSSINKNVEVLGKVSDVQVEVLKKGIDACTLVNRPSRVRKTIEGFLISWEDGDEVNDAHDHSPSPLLDDEFMKRVKKTKVEKLSIVDHSKV